MDVVFLIVTYEPPRDEFLKHLARNILAASHIIIVDNSYTSDSISFIRGLNGVNLTVIQNFSNIGIAEAQNIGIQRFFDLGGEYLLQIDQDSSISKESLNILLDYYIANADTFNLAGVGPSVSLGRAAKVREIKSSGLLLPKAVILNVGLFQSDLFIDLVDYEWCWRASKLNYSFHEVPCEFFHQLGSNFRVLGLLDLSIPTPIRHYYQVRNSLRLIFSFKSPLSWSVSRLFIIVLKFLIYPILLPHGKQRFKYMFTGFMHFLRNKTGKIDV